MVTKPATLSATVLRLFGDLEELRVWVRTTASPEIAFAFDRDSAPLLPESPPALLTDTLLVDALRPGGWPSDDPEMFCTAVPLEIAEHIVRELIRIGDSMRADVYQKTDDRRLRLVTAEWVAASYLRVLRPLLCQHPQLAPPGFSASRPSYS